MDKNRLYKVLGDKTQKTRNYKYQWMVVIYCQHQMFPSLKQTWYKEHVNSAPVSLAIIFLYDIVHPFSPLPPSTTTRLTSLCRTTVPVKYSWLALASTLNFLAGFCRLRILNRKGKVLRHSLTLQHTNAALYICTGVCSLSLQIQTYTLRCEHHRWCLLLTSWPSSLSSALLWVCERHWPLHEPCRGGDAIRKTLKKASEKQWMVQEIRRLWMRGKQCGVQWVTNFCLLAICALTWASTFVGSWTASVPSTLIRLEIRTEKMKSKHQLYSV